MFNRFKKWATTSEDCRFFLSSPTPVWMEGSEVKFSYNPFRGFLESPHYFMSRIYRKNFWTGIKDTFNIITGNHYHKVNEAFHVGIIDIFIFPLIARKLISNHKDDAQCTNIFSPVLAMIGGLLQIPRLLLGGALTLALSPIVAIVHLTSYFKAKKLKNTLRNYQDINNRTPLRFLYKNKCDYDSQNHRFIIKDQFRSFSLDVHDKNAAVIDALLQTNTLHITQKLEASKKLDEVKDLITPKALKREAVIRCLKDIPLPVTDIIFAAANLQEEEKVGEITKTPSP